MIDTDGDKQRFQIAICGLWQTFNPVGQPLPIETQRAYLMALGDLGIDAVESAMMRAMRSLKWFPKPVEIRDLCGLSDAAGVHRAWSKLQHAMVRYGCYDVITFADPALSATVKAMGGMRHLASMPIKEFETFGWHRFKECYQSMLYTRDTSNAGIEFRTSSNFQDGREPKRLSVGGESAPVQIASEAASLVLIKRP